ncbi:MAG TPA: glycosyltransferase [Solirubrobacterales bacterium]|nr:glycosyltransferase [Solirubrobacterales bacterium]
MPSPRPEIHGRSIVLGEAKLHIRGATYGTFRGAGDSHFPPPDRVQADFEAMAQTGANALRTYVTPPIWLLDLAEQHGLHVMAGLPWEQHVAFLEEPARARAIETRVAEQVRACRGHPAILCYAIGNEIPAPIVRWHGKRPVERFLERLFWSAKAEDPDGLFTYVNYPSTEYLDLPFLDLSAFNVFLEDEKVFENYLARLQNLSGDRPLLVTEAGLDSRRHGQAAQAEAVGWQVRHAFGTGAAGVFVFSWTDEWHRGGHDVLDWDFGMVDRERRPKHSLDAVRDTFAAAPFARSGAPSRISVVVCTHNGAATLAECLNRLQDLRYPDYEVIVVDDGSTDGSSEIARRFDVELLETDHRGLSVARNIGSAHASGEIVAFLDDDAYPDQDWLDYVALAFENSSHAGIGGPNLPPPEDGRVAECVAEAPGAPIHVLISDREAEHVPGCNMAFRKSALEGVGGFDQRFHTAGDDVDLCWRLQDAGETLGFSAGAVVTHRRRDTVRRYLKQQFGYGKAEAMLEQKWPSRHNRAGSLRWSGRIYDGASLEANRRRAKVNYGTWGTGLFQSVYEPAPNMLSVVLLMPESYLLLASLGAVALLGLFWAPLLVAVPFFLAGMGGVIWRAFSSGWRAHRPALGRSHGELLRRRLITGVLFLLQPLARLCGRLRYGLAPWRRRSGGCGKSPLPRTLALWSERWREHESRLSELQSCLIEDGAIVHSGGPFDRWDLEVRTGPLGAVRLRTTVEEHGGGRQLTRVRAWPKLARMAWLLPSLAVVAAAAWLDGEPAFALALALSAVAGALVMTMDCASAMGLSLRELSRIEERDKREAHSNGSSRNGSAGGQLGAPEETKSPDAEAAQR